MLLKSMLIFILTPFYEYLSASETAFLDWIRIVTFSGLLLMLDLGLYINSTRMFSYNSKENKKLERIIFSVSSVYKFLTSTLALLISVFFLAVYTLTDNFNFLGALSLLSVTLSFLNNIKLSFIQGVIDVHKAQKIQALSIIIALLGALILTATTKNADCLYLFYGHYLITFIFLKSYNMEGLCQVYDKNHRSKLISDSGKTGAGVLFSSVALQCLAIYSSYFLGPAIAIKFLFSFNIMRAIGSYSQVPLYSNIPLLVKSFRESRYSQMIFKASLLLLSSIFLYLIGISIIYLFSFNLINLGKSLSDLWSPGFLILSLVYLIDRIYNMLLQIYTATGHVVWHRTNFFYLISLIFALIVVGPGVTAVLFGMLIGSASGFLKLGYISYQRFYPNGK